MGCSLSLFLIYLFQKYELKHLVRTTPLVYIDVLQPGSGFRFGSVHCKGVNKHSIDN